MVNWPFFLGAAWMFLVTNWMYENNWNSVLARDYIGRFFMGNLLGKILGRVGIYIATILLFYFGITLALSERTSFIFGVIGMFLADAIMFSHILFKEVRAHIVQQGRKKTMKLQYYGILVITFIFLFVLD